MKSSSSVTPRASDSGEDETQLVLSYSRQPLRSKEFQKPSRWVHATWITVVLVLVLFTGLALYLSFAEDMKQGKVPLGLQSGSVFRQIDMFYPCEEADKANPSCTETEPFHEKPAQQIDTLASLDYVSKRDPPPGFEHWLKFAEENKCMSGSYTRIEKDLEAFRDARTGRLRILRHHVQGAQNMSSTTSFSVKNGNLEFGEDTFSQQFAGLMTRFIQFLPDMEFVVNIMDEPRVLPGNTDDVDERMGSPVCQKASESFVKHRNLHGFVNNRQNGEDYQPNPELIALFSQTKVNECFRDIMFPTLYTLGSELPAADEAELRPWSEREDKLFFRGSTTGGYFDNFEQQGKSHRQRLIGQTVGHPHADLKFTSHIQCEQTICTKMEHEYGLADLVPYMENFNYKYLMSIDGNTFVSRLPRFMQSGSLMFRAGIFDEWFEEWLEEGKHYLRVALDYSDLDDKIQWALNHDEEARKIGLNGRDFSKKHLRKEDMECYLFRLLLEYANILELQA